MAKKKSELTDVTAKVVICEAFVEGRLEAPKHLARTVHDLCFVPNYEEFREDEPAGLAVINRRMASRLWPGQNAVSR